MSYTATYLDELAATVQRISRAEVQAVVDALLNAANSRRQIFIIGNGGSAATASHMMNDLNKLTIAPGQPRLRAIALTDNMPLVTAWGNDVSFDESFAEPLRNLMQPGDVLIAISTSGNSPNIVRAVEVAHGEFQAQVIGLVGDVGGKLAQLADLVIRVPSPHIGQQEDGHLILNHAIANAIAQQRREAAA